MASGSWQECGLASLCSVGVSTSLSLMDSPAPSPGGVITPQPRMPSTSSAPSPCSHSYLSSSLWCPSVVSSTRCPASPPPCQWEASATTCGNLKNDFPWWENRLKGWVANANKPSFIGRKNTSYNFRSCLILIMFRCFLQYWKHSLTLFSISSYTDICGVLKTTCRHAAKEKKIISNGGKLS